MKFLIAVPLPTEAWISVETEMKDENTVETSDETADETAGETAGETADETVDEKSGVIAVETKDEMIESMTGVGEEIVTAVSTDTETLTPPKPQSRVESMMWYLGHLSLRPVQQESHQHRLQLKKKQWTN